MRLPTVRRRSLPAVVGCGLVVASLVAASCVAALTGGPGRTTGGSLGAGRSAQKSGASAANSTAGGASLTGSSAPARLSLPSATGASSGPARSGSAASQGRTVPPSSGGGNGGGGTGGSGGGSSTGGQGAGASATTTQQSSAAGASVPRLVVPDVIASVPGGVTAADLARIRKLSQVMTVLPISGARIEVNGRQIAVLGARAAALRPWTPPETAVSQRVWADFAAGDLIATAGSARQLRLVAGRQYPVTAAVRTRMTFGTQTLLGIAGVDAIVNQARASQLGLVRNVAVLINAPAANVNTLVAQVKRTLGSGSQVVRLVPVEVSTSLPVDSNAPKGRPTSYLSLFQESAAQYCPGLSWTVLAAIGQIESGDGANVGPSTAGALGPMQFLPSTWRVWGIDGFGETGPPDIFNPFDAVPSAARMLCADGAAHGGQTLRQAIFDYNHAGWYVDEVLTLADEYAREFS